MKYIIFYSWQSDLPNNTNRGFVESVIEKAIKDIRNTGEYELEPSLDRDTQGVPGAPNITQAIIDKINACDAFVADISIVTGDKTNGKRLSPNPNVLLELGYAIAILGWDKIILFCNEVHGTDEDLPFDIRQHRRIGYRLLQNEPKAEVRQDLAAHFKSRLIELLQKGKINSNIKQPFLSVLWNYLNIPESNDSDSGVDANTIILERITDFDNLIDDVKEEILAAKRINGIIDPEWDDKLNNYIERANKFISELEDQTKKKNFLIDFNVTKTYPVTLSVENDGNATASDIRVEIPLPEWLLTFEDFPKKSDVPVRPSMPTPKPPRIGSAIKTFGNITAFNHMLTDFDHLLLGRNINRISACSLKEADIYFWADRLLHKHVITNRSDRFYLLALPNAPEGEVVLKGRAFCAEYEDWQEIELIIKVV